MWENILSPSVPKVVQTSSTDVPGACGSSVCSVCTPLLLSSPLEGLTASLAYKTNSQAANIDSSSVEDFHQPVCPTPSLSPCLSPDMSPRLFPQPSSPVPPPPSRSSCLLPPVVDGGVFLSHLGWVRHSFELLDDGSRGKSWFTPANPPIWWNAWFQWYSLSSWMWSSILLAPSAFSSSGPW